MPKILKCVGAKDEVIISLDDSNQKEREFKSEELIMKNKFHVSDCYVKEVYMIYTNRM